MPFRPTIVFSIETSISVADKSAFWFTYGRSLITANKRTINITVYGANFPTI
jgi:hypothetical protein